MIIGKEDNFDSGRKQTLREEWIGKDNFDFLGCFGFGFGFGFGFVVLLPIFGSGPAEAGAGHTDGVIDQRHEMYDDISGLAMAFSGAEAWTDRHRSHTSLRVAVCGASLGGLGCFFSRASCFYPAFLIWQFELEGNQDGRQTSSKLAICIVTQLHSILLFVCRSLLYYSFFFM